MSVATGFNESYYLSNNADVVLAISQGHFTSALQHYQLFGGKSELRDPNSTFDASYYASKNPDVLTAVSNGLIANVFTHYQIFGEKENRAPSVSYEGFTATAYLAANADVQAAVTAGTIASALEHYIAFGASESRSGSGITASTTAGTTYTLTTAADDLTGTSLDDTFKGGVSATAADNTLGLVDSLNGGAGNDTLSVTAAVLAADISVPSAGLSNIETVSIKAVDADGTVGTDAATFAAVTGVTAVNASGNSNVTVTGLASGASVGMVGDGNTKNGILSYAYTTATEAQTINISGGTLNTGVANITATASAGVTTATINSTGAANKVDIIKLDSAGANTVTSLTVNATTGLTATLTAADYANTGALTVTGAGAVDLGTNGVFKTIDASANSGGLTIDVDTVATSVKGGSGNDVFTSSATTATTAGLVDAGAGTDTLILNAVADVDTSSEGAEYVNFETMRLAGTLNTSFVAGITALEITGTSALSALTATQAANITVRADAGASSFALATATGTSDVITLNMGTGGTANAEATDFTGALTVNGFETLNINTKQGATASTTDEKTTTIASLTADVLTKINLTGNSVTLTDAATTKATTIDGSALTGVLTVAGNLIAGSSVTGGAGADVFTAGTNNGVTYTGGAGNDKLSATVAQLTATGTNDTKFVGGADTDTLDITGNGVTVTDNQFTNISGVETITLASTTSVSLTSGAGFNSAFSGGVTISEGVTAATNTLTYSLGLATVDVTINSIGGSQTGATTEDVNITTGSGADTVTFSATGWVGVAGAAGEINISTGSGADTISVTTGTLLAITGGTGGATITGGTGADKITAVHVNGGTTGNFNYVIADGDSLVSGRDVITGFDLGGGGSLFSDTLDFTDVSGVLNGGAVNGTDSGVIKSHSTATGIITFDDVDTYAAALTINSGNLSDVITYLTTNLTTAGQTAAFAYDSTGNGTADSTMVFNAGVGANDSLVELVGVVGTSLSATNANTAGLIDVG